jgi:hypothetical protein
MSGFRNYKISITDNNYSNFSQKKTWLIFCLYFILVRSDFFHIKDDEQEMLSKRVFNVLGRPQIWNQLRTVVSAVSDFQAEMPLIRLF